MNKKLTATFIVSALLLPAISFAAFNAGAVPFAPPINNFFTMVAPFLINQVLMLLWVVLVAYAIIMFIIAGFQFLSARGEPAELKKARDSMIWGTAGVVVAVIAFSLPRILIGFFRGG